MNLVNSYATLSDYKAYVVARGQSATTDTTDDGVIQDLLVAASRYLDLKTWRIFYPRVEETLFDIPESNDLYLDNDMLEIVSLTNGDAVLIASTQYITQGAKPPFWCVSLRRNSTVSWETPTSGNTQQVISLIGINGTHDQYTQRAWAQVGTLGVAMSDTTTLAFTASAGHSLVAGNIIKIGSEIMNVVTVATNTITPIKRGDNGSTAATHLINTAVYAWQPMEGARMSVLEIANSSYKKRFGQNTGESATVTAAGVVLTPRDIPATAQDFILSMSQMV